MSKELWFVDYEEKLNELEGDPDAEEKAINYAEGYMERLYAQADMLRKERRENNG